MKCGIALLRPLPARARCWSAGTARSSATPGRAPGWPSGSCDDTSVAKPTGRVEARLLRRLPAHPARLRGRAARASPARSRSRTSSRRPAPRSPGRTTCPWWRGRSPPSGTPAESARSARRPGRWSHRGLRDRRRHPGPAQLRRRRGVHLGGVRAAGVHLDPGHLDPGRRSRQGRLRAARLPDRPAPAARGAHRPAGRPQAADPDAQRLLRVQAARHVVRHGGAGHAVPGPGHPGRVRGDLPGLRPRLLRLLRPGGQRRTCPP